MNEIPQSRRTTIRAILAEFKVIPVRESLNLSSGQLGKLFSEHEVVEGTVAPGFLFGFTSAGVKRINSLVREIRKGPPLRTKVVSNEVLAEKLRKDVTARWGEKPGDNSDEQIDELLWSLEAWFEGLSTKRIYVVPCRIIPDRHGAFVIGPVRLYPLPQGSDPENGDTSFDHLLEFSGTQKANWLAEIAVSGREERQASATADLMVDVALGAFQALCGPHELRNIVRVTGRSIPVLPVRYWRERGGASGTQMSNLTPGLGISASEIGKHFHRHKKLVGAVGERLDGFLSGKSSTPNLDEGWCNAAYWYHEALAEPLETVAVAKLETAIEVLFGAESASGSKQRLLQAMSAMFGMEKDIVLQNAAITVERFVALIVKARSRVLHGTWATLQSDMPTSGEGHASFLAVEPLARGLLLKSAEHISSGSSAGLMIDDIPSLLRWAALNPLNN